MKSEKDQYNTYTKILKTIHASDYIHVWEIYVAINNRFCKIVRQKTKLHLINDYGMTMMQNYKNKNFSVKVICIMSKEM